MITEKELQVIDLITKKNGIGIVALPEVGTFYAVSSFTPSQTSNEIEYHQLTGNDITTKIKSYDVSIASSNTVEVDREAATKMKIHKDIKFIHFLP